VATSDLLCIPLDSWSGVKPRRLVSPSATGGSACRWDENEGVRGVRLRCTVGDNSDVVSALYQSPGSLWWKYQFKICAYSVYFDT
jgi:hypothetical protein